MTSRRHPARRDVVNSAFCHVATSLRTSRRRLVTCLLTSRRCPSRRDVGFITLCHVATSPRTSRRCPVLSPRTVHFWLFTSHSTNRNPSFPAHQPSPDLLELPSHRSEVPPFLSDHLYASQSYPLQLVPGHCGIPTTLYSALALFGSYRVSLHSQLVQGPLWSKFRVFLGFRVLSHS